MTQKDIGGCIVSLEEEDTVSLSDMGEEGEVCIESKLDIFLGLKTW